MFYLRVVGNSSGAQRKTLPKHPDIPNFPIMAKVTKAESCYKNANKYPSYLHILVVGQPSSFAKN